MIALLNIGQYLMLYLPDFKAKIAKYSPVTEDDFSGSIQSLYRLQTVYLLNTTELANGVIDGVKYRLAINTKYSNKNQC
jgi:hypothetical protein